MEGFHRVENVMYYKWQWTYDADDKIVCEGEGKYINPDDCQGDAEKNQPLPLYDALCRPPTQHSVVQYHAYSRNTEENESLLKVEKVSFFMWEWVWNDGSHMSGADTCFSDPKTCSANANTNKPSYDTFDGPGAPYLVLVIHAYAADHKPPPRLLVRDEIKPQKIIKRSQSVGGMTESDRDGEQDDTSQHATRGERTKGYVRVTAVTIDNDPYVNIRKWISTDAGLKDTDEGILLTPQVIPTSILLT